MKGDVLDKIDIRIAELEGLLQDFNHRGFPSVLPEHEQTRLREAMLRTLANLVLARNELIREEAQDRIGGDDRKKTTFH